MAHLVDTMAYAGATPWHGLGNKVEKGASIETWIAQSGLTWTAESAMVAYKPNGHWQPADGYQAIYRSDTGRLFHIASQRYKPVQPAQILEFFRDLSDKHGMEIETCGALKDGAIVWALATNGNDIRVSNADIVKPYLLLSTTFDGTQATRAAYTTVRVVCNNTLRLSMSQDNDNVVSVRHSTVFDDQAVKARLGLLDEETAQFANAANQLANTPVDRDTIEQKLIDWFGVAKDKDKPIGPGNLTTQSSNVIKQVEHVMVTAPGQDLDTARGTAWGVLGGVTRYVDFEARARSADNRLTSAWFGKGDQIKSRAFHELLALSKDQAVAKPDAGPSSDVFQQLLSKPFRPQQLN